MALDADSSELRRATVVGPGALPAGLEGWECRHVPELPDARADGPPGVIVLHARALRAAGRWQDLAAWLADGEGDPAVLVLGDVDGAELADLFRAGLFDAVHEQAPPARWREVLERAERQVEIRRAERAIQADAAFTHQQLQDSRRRLRHETAAETAALLQAQTELERANQKLADHMAQVSLLYQFGRELSLASNWDDTLRDILAHLAEFVGAAGGALVLRAAPGGPYAPRQTYRWQEQSWDKVLLRITRQIDAGVASSLLAPGVFQVGRGPEGDSEGGGRITALPLEHQGLRLGMLLLLFADAAEREGQSAAYLSFLQMVQVVLSEEVAAAQMLDRLRDIVGFNTQVLETVSSAIWVCDGGGRTIFVNRAARGILGLELGPRQQADADFPAVGRGRMLDRPLTGGAEHDDLPEIFLDGNLTLRNGEAARLPGGGPYEGEGHVTDVHGESIPVRVQATPMVGRGRDESWLLVILEDRREARRAEAARRRAEQAEALVAMSATLAHEIRNPLMGLSAQAELLADSLGADDPRRGRIDLITGEVERINRTITDMLQFVRPCAPRRSETDPARLVRACLDLVRPRADELGVTLTMTATPGRTAAIDPDQLTQVLLNLLLNAVDAAAPDGEVAVRVAWPDALTLGEADRTASRLVPGLVVTVEDDGPGFGAVDSEKLFEPFFTTKTTGTGLGLAYSRKVVDAHGGEIRAQRDGAKTRMEVLLPRNAEAGKQLAGEAS